MKHGTANCYGYHKCRCADCKASVAAYRRKYRQDGRESEQDKKRWQKNYYENNKEAFLERTRTYRLENKEASALSRANWKRLNKERVNEMKRKRSALKKNLTVLPFTNQQLLERLSMFSGCWICGGPKEAIDHVKPLSKGGPHCLANLKPACRSCNSIKHNRWPFSKEMVLRVR